MRNNYAGDEAWTEWFERCCVANCAPESHARLTEQIRSAMFGQLARFGFPPNMVAREDAVLFFDAFFLIHGDQTAHKPLKSYFKHRIAVERLKLRDFVCGTLFGSGHGRIHDIVRDWIADVKGWKPHSLVGKDGLRHISWESADPKPDSHDICAVLPAPPGARLDREFLRGCVHEMLDLISSKIKVEKSAIAFLLYAMAQGIPVSSPEVLARLKVRKSRAHQLKEKVMKQIERYLSEKEIDSNDLAFARVMIAECDCISGKEA